MKQAVVIGAGKIGRAIAEHLAGRHHVVVASHQDIELASIDDVARFFATLDRVDVLVNAAGTYGAVGRVRELPPADWRTALDVNLIGVYASCHHAMKRMGAGGHIINVAGGGKGPQEMRSAYAASKSALWRFTETLAAEEPDLRVNAIAPGPMDSRMQDAVVAVCQHWADFVREMRSSGRGATPIENTLRVLDHILTARPTGQLFFAREFSARPALVSQR